VIHDEDRLKQSERDMWNKGEWPAAILSSSTRHCFLHLLRMRDAARTGSSGSRMLVAALFYPAYVVAFAVWVAIAMVLTALLPVLFLGGAAWQHTRVPEDTRR